MHLFYFWLSSVEMAIDRVALRVKKGGHHIPEATIRQRYLRSIRNLFELYIPVVTMWKVYDNSLGATSELVAEGMRDGKEIVHIPATWLRIKESADA